MCEAADDDRWHRCLGGVAGVGPYASRVVLVVRADGAGDLVVDGLCGCEGGGDAGGTGIDDRCGRWISPCIKVD